MIKQRSWHRELKISQHFELLQYLVFEINIPLLSHKITQEENVQVISFIVDRLAPNPYTLSAGISCWVNNKLKKLINIISTRSLLLLHPWGSKVCSTGNFFLFYIYRQLLQNWYFLHILIIPTHINIFKYHLSTSAASSFKKNFPVRASTLISCKGCPSWASKLAWPLPTLSEYPVLLIPLASPPLVLLS